MSEERTHYHKGQIRLMKKSNQQYYAPATWAWLRKNVDPKDLEIQVMVWGMDGQQNPGLFQWFTPDDVKGAKKYAQWIVGEGGASMSVITGKIYLRHYEGQQWHSAVDFGSYERA